MRSKISVSREIRRPRVAINQHARLFDYNSRAVGNSRQRFGVNRFAPPPMRSPLAIERIMNFTRDTEDDDWTGNIEVLGKIYPCEIRACYEPGELAPIASRTQQYLDANYRQILDQIVTDLLPMYNEEWSEDDSAPLDAAQFLDQIGPPEINVWEEEALMIYFDDGGLFGGHYIEVFIETPENNRDVSIGIVG